MQGEGGGGDRAEGNEGRARIKPMTRWGTGNDEKGEERGRGED